MVHWLAGTTVAVATAARGASRGIARRRREQTPGTGRIVRLHNQPDDEEAGEDGIVNA